MINQARVVLKARGTHRALEWTNEIQRILLVPAVEAVPQRLAWARDNVTPTVSGFPDQLHIHSLYFTASQHFQGEGILDFEIRILGDSMRTSCAPQMLKHSANSVAISARMSQVLVPENTHSGQRCDLYNQAKCPH